MEFLTKLYENESFIYILIGVLVILVILFLIVLFTGKKKKNETGTEEIKGEPSSAADRVLGVTESIASVPLVDQVVVNQPASAPEQVENTSMDATKEFNPEDLSSTLMETPSEPIPVVETPTPVVEEPTPVIEEPVPVVEENVVPVNNEVVSESVMTAPFEENVVETIKEDNNFNTFEEPVKEDPNDLTTEVNLNIEVKDENPVAVDSPVFPETVDVPTSPVFPEEAPTPVVEKTTQLFTIKPTDDLPKLNEEK